MKRQHIIMLGVIFLAVFISASFAWAGTGGTEVQGWWTEISTDLKGFWGKMIAIFFIGSAIMAFREGGVLGGIFLFLLGLLVGTVPDIVNARYTLTF